MSASVDPLAEDRLKGMPRAHDSWLTIRQWCRRRALHAHHSVESKIVTDHPNETPRYKFDGWDDADYLLGLDLDYRTQVIAIEALLARQTAADSELSERIDELSARARDAEGEQADHLVDMSVDHMHFSVYQHAAHAMAAVGMLAPLFESMLGRTFAHIGERPWPIGKTDRLTRAGADHADLWNAQICFTVDGPKADILGGVRQLAKMTGLASRLPCDFHSVFEALMLYRNNMLHNGLEWPVEKRAKFQNQIERREWEHWFNAATTGGEPWAYYMTDALIAQCLKTFDKTMVAVSALVKAQSDIHGWSDEPPAPVPDYLKAVLGDELSNA